MIFEVNEPLQSTKPPPRRGLWAFMLCFYLLVHGLPLLCVGLTGSSSENLESAYQTSLSEQEREKLGRFVLAHFDSVEQLQRFYLTMGGGLTALALAGQIPLYRAASRREAEAQIEESRVLASAGICFEPTSTS